MLKHYLAIFWARNLTTYRVLFCIPPRSKILSLPDCTKAIYVETLYSDFLSAKFDNVSSTFFVYQLGQKFFLYQTVLGQWHSSLDRQFIWISPWLGWKAIYVATLYSDFLSTKFDNVSSTFFIYHLGQKKIPSQSVLRQWHSSLDPQFILISPWLGWKPIYVETLNSEFFSAKFDNVSSTFFVYQLGQKFFLYQTVLGQWHSSLDPQFVWISPWLGWKAIYVATLYSDFFEHEIWQRIEYFFRIPPRSKKNSLSDCTQTVTLLPRPSIHFNKSLTRLKTNLCWKH